MLAWLQVWRPDVLCLQELKTEPALLPLPALWALGYQVAFLAEKHWNGVAICARHPIEDVRLGFGDGRPEPDARLVSAMVGGVRVLSAYVPHGREVGHGEWRYKLEWLERLRAHLDAHYLPTDPLVLCGDFNVAPEARDVWDPKSWLRKVHYHPDARVALRHVLAFGLHDTFRQHHAAGGFHSWWDYKARDAIAKNRGLRIDHVFATRPLAERCRFAAIDLSQRIGDWPCSPSDHVPVMSAFDDA